MEKNGRSKNMEKGRKKTKKPSGVSCERFFVEFELQSRLGSRVFTDHFHSTLSHLHVIHQFCLRRCSLVSFWEHCGDQLDRCSQCLAVNFDRCGRFMAQGE